MCAIFFLLAIIAPALVLAQTPTPIKVEEHYKIYKLSDLPPRTTTFTERRETKFGTLRTVVEQPTDDYSPEDYGGNFGDMEFETTVQDRDLVNRDIVANSWYPYNIAVFYNRTFPGHLLTDGKILNFGRMRGWAYRAVLDHWGGSLLVEIHVRAGVQMRLFIEVYGEADF